MRNDPVVAPDYHLLKLGERVFWSEEVQKQTTAIYGVYAYDRNEYTYCCELTPSHCLIYISTDYIEVDDLSEDERSALNEQILDGAMGSEPAAYMHVRSVERFIKENPELTKKVDLDFDPEVDPFDQIAEGWATGALMF